MTVCPLSAGSVFASCWVKSRSYEPSASTVPYVHPCAGAKGDVLAVVVSMRKSQVLSASCCLKVRKIKPWELDDTRIRVMPTVPS